MLMPAEPKVLQFSIFGSTTLKRTWRMVKNLHPLKPLTKKDTSSRTRASGAIQLNTPREEPISVVSNAMLKNAVSPAAQIDIPPSESDCEATAEKQWLI